MGGPFAALLAIVLIAAIGFFGFTVRVNPEELGVVLRFGKFVRLYLPASTSAGLTRSRWSSYRR